ncbi:MFS transporter [Arthrobacter monumenti]
MTTPFYLSRRFWLWSTGSHLSNLPAAMAPLTFTALTATLTGSYSAGAGMVSAMILSQVALAIPVSRLLDRASSNTGLRLLLLLRAAVFGILLAAVLMSAQTYLLIGLAALAGAAGSAVPGGFRALLTGIVGFADLRRSVALTATLNELMFVIGPVLVGVLGLITESMPLIVMAALTAAAAAFVPGNAPAAPSAPQVKGASMVPRLFGWMLAGFAAASIVAIVEVGAVALALRLGRDATWATVIVVVLCIASVSGGVFWTWRNYRGSTAILLVLLAGMMAGAVLIALGLNFVFVLAGAVLVGLCLAPLGTTASLLVEDALDPHRRIEGFSLLRTASGLGAGFGALLVTLVPIGAAASAGVVALAGAVAGLYFWARLSTRRNLTEPAPTSEEVEIPAAGSD